ncbi:MAG: hypothetical protein ACD_78C00214G0003 [uncultured bacterium (gcode 4)]|uniref:Uncharacterized protein n=1 Tax=uncultured bacterium (gcode 4) TaxID=1234023 RepID=K1XXH1_9BACT|nr:MAG: hypothetical protein ACD_78C00214G0003 [uncultured bacterium (gcode 4)]
MKLPKSVLETQKIVDFLEARNLVQQYKKSKKNLLSWNIKWLDFKERQPKKSWIWSFRINKQFRVFWSFDTEFNFIVSSIDNHQ